MTEASVSDRPGCGWLILTILANFVVHAFCAVAIIAVFGSASWFFTMYFDNLDVELAAITQTTLDIQRLVTNWWYLFAPLLLVGALVFALLASRSSRWRWLATVYSFLAPLATIGLFVFAFVAFALPLAKLVDDMKPPAAEQPPNQQAAS